MENCEIIFDEDVEQIVNNHNRKETGVKIKTNKRREKMARIRNRAIICLTLSGVVVALGFLELVKMWFAVVISFVLCIVSAFFFGRWIENWKIYMPRGKSDERI